MTFSDSLDALRGLGWTVELTDADAPLLPDEVSTRYPSLPSRLVEFLGRLDVCVSADQTAWVLTRRDYSGDPELTFRWNEFELMALGGDWADPDDPKAPDATREFWNGHFPFMMAVHSDYDYLAVCLDDNSVVHGSVPFWEEPERVAASFDELLLAIAKVPSKGAQFPISLFLGADYLRRHRDDAG